MEVGPSTSSGSFDLLQFMIQQYNRWFTMSENLNVKDK
jgi:hypothetical protein